MFLAETSIQLVPDGTMLVHLVVVVIMVAIVNRTLLGPINRILEVREKEIRGRLSEAEELETSRKEKLREYDATLRNARSEGYHLLEKERAEALKEKDERVRKAKEEIGKNLAAELEVVHRQEEQVRGELESQAVTVSDNIVSRVLSR